MTCVFFITPPLLVADQQDLIPHNFLLFGDHQCHPPLEDGAPDFLVSPFHSAHPSFLRNDGKRAAELRVKHKQKPRLWPGFFHRFLNTFFKISVTKKLAVVPMLAKTMVLNRSSACKALYSPVIVPPNIVINHKRLF